MNRREFLKACAAAGIAVTAPHVIAYAETREAFDAGDVERMKQVYVDPFAKENGIGTMESPFNDLQDAMHQTQFDPVRGVRINIKASA